MSFLYYKNGEPMKIYLDLILFLNFAFDFVLLLGVSILLRRNAPLHRILLGAFVGSLSIMLLFFNINSLTLFFAKVVISIFMVITAFGFQNIKYTSKNLFYLYTSSMILGGFLYYLNTEFSYKQVGIVFYHNGLSINFIFLIIFSPIIIYFYVRQALELKTHYSKYYKIKLYFKDFNPITVSAFLDTGNRLIDPYFKRPVILVDKYKIPSKLLEKEFFYVPYKTITGMSILKCIVPIKVEIKGVKVKEKCLIGILEEGINIEGIDCILHSKLLEN